MGTIGGLAIVGNEHGLFRSHCDRSCGVVVLIHAFLFGCACPYKGDKAITSVQNIPDFLKEFRMSL